MKNFVEKLLSTIPYFVLVLIAGLLFILVYQNSLTFEQVKDLISILIWPTVVFFALLFFRKVITYLFFSMEEFGFFGTKGRLKNITEVINEKVQERIHEEKFKEEQNKKVFELEKRLDSTAKSGVDAKTEAENNLKLAKQIFEDLKKALAENENNLKELNELRKKEVERAERNRLMHERLRRSREERRIRQELDEPTSEEMQKAEDLYIQGEIDRRRGK